MGKFNSLCKLTLSNIGVQALREVKRIENRSGHAKSFSEAIREIHEQVREALNQNALKVKAKDDKTRRDVPFHERDLVMVHINKEIHHKDFPTPL